MSNLVNWQQEEPTDCGGERQLSVDGTSRVSREAQARICERLGVRFPGATRPSTDLPTLAVRLTNRLRRTPARRACRLQPFVRPQLVHTGLVAGFRRRKSTVVYGWVNNAASDVKESMEYRRPVQRNRARGQTTLRSVRGPILVLQLLAVFTAVRP